jgi:UDP-N-acetylglucosamine 2-epimerase
MTSAVSEKIRVLTVVGTRPEAIKLAPVVRALQSDSAFAHCLCATGQHREMLDQVMGVFEISADIDLQLMRPRQSLGQLTADALVGIQKAVADFRPDFVLVQGDTTTAFSGALAAFYERCKVAHVEAGLRTGNLNSPWPEELNRRLISQIASIHFAPTQWARANLLTEGVSADQVLVTGNTVIDALQWVASTFAQTSPDLQRLGVDLGRLEATGKKIILVTGHRRENLDGGLAAVCNAVGQLARRNDVEVVFPVHLNPAVQSTVNEHLGHLGNVHLLPPVDYVAFAQLLSACYLVITDSGGVQEEAPGLGKPVLVTRDTTERPEAIEAGTAKLVGTDTNTLLLEATRLLDDPVAHSKMAHASNPYGDGHASERIVSALKSHSRSQGK